MLTQLRRKGRFEVVMWAMNEEGRDREINDLSCQTTMFTSLQSTVEKRFAIVTDFASRIRVFL